MTKDQMMYKLRQHKGKLIIAGIILLVLSMQTRAEQDELECVLPNEDKFILINAFDYVPATLRMGCWHCSARMATSKKPFRVYFHPKGGSRSKEPVMERLGEDTQSIQSGENRSKLCANFSLFGSAMSPGGVPKMQGNQKVFDFKTWISPSIPREFYEDIQKTGLYPFTHPGLRAAYLAAFQDKFVYEVPLAKSDALGEASHIVSVIQSTSIDGGKTWSEPIITTDSKLFEIGKPLIDQKGIAKPGKYIIGPGSD